MRSCNTSDWCDLIRHGDMIWYDPEKNKKLVKNSAASVRDFSFRLYARFYIRKREAVVPPHIFLISNRAVA